MIEILFFALLSGYLFFRLWSVLGNRDGFDKKYPFEDSEEMPLKNNVVELPRRPTLVSENMDLDITESPFWEELHLIQEKEPDFQLHDFMDNSKMAFEIITKAFVEGDKETLQMLLAPFILKQFCEVIDKRITQHQTTSNEIVGEIQSHLESIKITKNIASLTLKFTSYQRFITYDADGKIMDNPEEIAIRMVNLWTFSKPLGDTDPVWYLSKTSIGD